MMTSFNDLQSAEPAFMAKRSATKQPSNRRSQATSGPQKTLHDCCFSLSNLALIIASIVALIFSIKFLFDEVLYEHGEHLLSLRFYRQIIYIIVILPLILLVPLFNTITALFLSDRLRFELGNSLLTVKLIYQVVLAILVFIGLAFVAPYIRQSSVATGLAHELRRHMSRRYDNDFSYEFIDQIQEEYRCCDELWYRANYYDKLPVSCFVPDGQFSSIYEHDCADEIGGMVANRCVVIAICLIVLLVALCSLIGIDLMELLTRSRNEYNVSNQESKLHSSATSLERIRGNSPRQMSPDSDDDDEGDLVGRNSQVLNTSALSGSRLRVGERERDSPLLAPTQLRSQQQRQEEEEDHEVVSWNYQQKRETPEPHLRQPTPILTRANYVNHYSHRAQSPLFVGQVRSNGSERSNEGDDDNQSNESRSLQATPKSALKKGSSFQRIDSVNGDEDEEHCEGTGEVQDYQRQLQRELQTRRSLLNVRFAE